LGPLETRREEAVAALAKAQEQRGEAEAALATAEEQRSTAAQTRSEAESALSSARAALSALEGERQALTRALGSGDAAKDRLLDHVKAAPGYEHALAAALGDELEVGLDRAAARHWAGAEALPQDPALPEGTERLSDHVTAPAALARRLAQIAVAKTDYGAALAVGQRLVTKAGALRRWDGFTARGGEEASGAATAQRLIRANRLDALQAQLPDARAAVDQAETERAAAAQAAVEAEGAITSLRSSLSQADRDIAVHTRARDDAAAQIERLADRRADISTRVEEARAELAATSKEHEAALAAAQARAAMVARWAGSDQPSRPTLAALDRTGARRPHARATNADALRDPPLEEPLRRGGQASSRYGDARGRDRGGTRGAGGQA
jgi:chromosome segregation protein